MARPIAAGALGACPARHATRVKAVTRRASSGASSLGGRRGRHARRGAPSVTALADDDDDDEAADDEAELARTLDAMVESTRAAGAGARLHVVAFSGGVDSSLAAYVVHRAFGDGESGASSPRCAAAIGVSPSLPQSQLQIARDVAAHIGIDLWEVPTHEGDVPEYVANEGESCLHCKNTLYSTLRNVAAAGIDSLATQGADSAVPGDGDVVLYNGTNADDLTDPTRLGLLAASHHRVESPCCQLDKASVRRLARLAKLPNWNLAAAPCLRSRLATGVPATTQTLGDVEAAEAAVRETLQIAASENMRVRVLSRAGDKALAALELEPSRVKMDDEVFDALSATLGTHGLWLSDVRAFESGSVAKRLEDDEIAKPAEWTSLFVHFRRPAARSANDGGDLLERWEAEQCEVARAGGDGFVVSFGTTWCGPCHVLEPELETLARFVWDFDDSVAVAKLDAEASRAETELAGRLGVDAYPTTIWMRGGVEVHRVEGALPAAALVQLTARYLMTAESTEVMRAERPEMFAPVPLEPF